MPPRLAVPPQYYVGHTLADGYLLDRVIGVGGFAAVYHASHPYGYEAAVKILLSDARQASRRFTREIKVMQSMPESPHLIKYLSHGVTSDGRAYLTMECIPGPTLSQGLRARPVLSADEACVVLYQVSLALQALHRYGVVHRDVKPSNVLMAPDGLVKLFDFGLVLDSEGMLRLFEEEDILSGHDFAEDIEKGAIAGTPEYMAPEQFEDPISPGGMPRLTGPASDVFSAGVILYRLLTGGLPLALRRKRSKPRTTEDVMAYLRARSDAIENQMHRPPRIERTLWSILTRALAREPDARQPDSRILAEDLFGYITEGTGTRYLREPSTQVTRRKKVARPKTTPKRLSVEILFGDLDLDTKPGAKPPGSDRR